MLFERGFELTSMSLEPPTILSLMVTAAIAQALSDYEDSIAFLFPLLPDLMTSCRTSYGDKIAFLFPLKVSDLIKFCDLFNSSNLIIFNSKALLLYSRCLLSRLMCSIAGFMYSFPKNSKQMTNSGIGSSSPPTNIRLNCKYPLLYFLSLAFPQLFERSL